MRQIVLDTETTGLSVEAGDRILEIGCVELVNRRLTGNDKHYYINPQRESHEDALRVHGITSEFLKDKPLFGQIADDLIEYLRDSELIIHNAPFDVGFLDKEFELLGRPPLASYGIHVIDSLVLAKEIFPGKRNSLDALCDRLEVDNSNRTLHGALLDAQLLADVYVNMTRGQHSLVIDAAAPSAGAPRAGGAAPKVDLSQLDLPVIVATTEELTEHERVMAEIDKASGGKALWALANKNEAMP